MSGNDHGTEDERNGIQEFAGSLEAILEGAGAGKYDGDEFGGGTVTLHFYGQSADEIWNWLEDPIRSDAPLPALRATLLYGDYRARRATVELDEEKPNKPA